MILENMQELFSIVSNTKWLIIATGTYLICSIPFGLIVTKVIAGKNITEYGSGNIGTSNVMRTVGRKGGIITFILDFFKAYIPLLLYFLFIEEFNTLSLYLLGLIAIIGHTKSIYLLFRGGKGVACLFAVMAAWYFPGAIILGLLWICIYLFSKVSSIAGISVAFLSIFFTYFNEGFSIPLLIHVILSLYIVALHRENIKRIIEGKEFRISSKAKE